MPLPHYKASTVYRKSMSNEHEEDIEISTSNAVAKENERKVKSLAEHMINNILSNEENYSISKHRVHKEGKVQKEENGNAEDEELEYVYELTYDNSDYDKGIDENVRLSITTESFRVRTSNSSLVKQNSTIFSELEQELSHAYGVYYANKISKALDDAMTKVGNARKYAINQYLEDAEESTKTVMTSAINGGVVAQNLKKSYKSSMNHNTVEDEYYGEEEGI